MAKIIPCSQVDSYLKKTQQQNKSLVLVGGCFDLLHKGHRQFLQKARKTGESLIVLLESDEMIKNRKGVGRPHETQSERARALAQLSYVTAVLLLPSQMDDQDYDKLVSEIKPAIIATTKGDPYRHHKERQAKQIGALVLDVIDRLPQFSTTDKSKTYEYQ